MGCDPFRRDKIITYVDLCFPYSYIRFITRNLALLEPSEPVSTKVKLVLKFLNYSNNSLYRYLTVQCHLKKKHFRCFLQDN